MKNNPLKKIFYLFSILLLVFPQYDYAKTKKGKLVIIGGDEKLDVLERFVKLAGGDKAQIVIFPMASSIPETAGLDYENRFKKLNANAFYLNINQAEANSDTMVSKIKNVTGVFFSGGDQVKLMEALKNTKIEKEIKEIFLNGGIIGGTSAGTAVMSEVMITGNEILNKDSNNYFHTIVKGNVETKEGFGFVTSAIIDQHFVVRKRHNRLISVVLENPNLIGIGIDEATGIIISPNNTFEVIGKSLVFVYDATSAKEISIGEEGTASAKNIKMTILKSGDVFKMKNIK